MLSFQQNNDTSGGTAAPPLKFEFAPDNPGKREVRQFLAREMRMEQDGERRYFTGYAALFNSLSEDLGGWKERIKPGAFSRTLQEVSQNKRDVAHLLNHSALFILGKTAAGTTVLWEDEIGLRFKTLCSDRSYELDLIKSMERGDVSQCSFSFKKNGDAGDRWVKTPEGAVRELLDVDLFDVSIVTANAAYTQTSAGLSFRSMFPEGAPAEIIAISAKAMPSHSTATSDKSWDGSANEARLKSDEGASYLRKAYAWQDSESDGTKKGDYKFIHHEVSASGDIGAANTKANQAIIANLNGARTKAKIPDADRPGVWAHAAKHLRDAGVEPAPLKDLAELDAGDDCECPCESCVAGNCDNCTNTECDDADCGCTYSQQNLQDSAASDLASQAEQAQVIREQRMASPKVEFRSAVDTEGTLEMLIYGDIGEGWYGGGITAKMCRDLVENAGAHSKIRLRINSFGGDAFEGVTIGNYLKSLGKPIEVCVDGLAASAASVIAMCGDVITMAGNAMMMVHNASSMAYGYASDMRKMADLLDTISRAVGQTYVDRTGNSMARVKELMDAETWMDAAQCVQEGFATRVKEPAPEEENRSFGALREAGLCARYAKVPDRFQAPKPSAEQEAVEDENRRRRLRWAQAI